MEWLIIGLLLANLAAIAYLLWSRNVKRPEDGQSMMLLQQQMQDLSRAMETKLGEGTNGMFENMKTQFGESQRLASDIKTVAFG